MSQAAMKSSALPTAARARCRPAVALLLAAAGLLGCAAAPAVRDAPLATPGLAPAAAPAAADNELGIRVTALRLSAGGFMIDLRYRVVDPELAKVLLDRRVPAFLQDEGTGAKFAVPTTPKLGRLRSGAQNNIYTDRDYAVLFGNPGGQLKPGSKVTLIAGELQVSNLTVQ